MLIDKLLSNHKIILINLFKVIKICTLNINLINKVFLLQINNNNKFKLKHILLNKVKFNVLNNILKLFKVRYKITVSTKKKYKI